MKPWIHITATVITPWLLLTTPVLSQGYRVDRAAQQKNLETTLDLMKQYVVADNWDGCSDNIDKLLAQKVSCSDQQAQSCLAIRGLTDLVSNSCSLNTPAAKIKA